MNKSMKRFASAVLAAVCALGLMIPGAAFAADTNTGISADDALNQTITWDEADNNVGDTQYWLQLEADDIEQISIDVPVRVVLAVNTDGSFVTPTALKNVIENNSEFPVNVSGISISPKDDFVVKAAQGFAGLSDLNIFNGSVSSVELNGSAIETTKQSVAFTKLPTYAANGAWAMEHSDGALRTGEDCLFVQINGNIANVSGHYFTAPINVFDLTYTFEATPATSVDDTGTTSLPATAASITD